MDYFRGKTLVVTGGAGSIGTQLTRRILQLGIAQLRVVDRDRAAIETLRSAIRDDRLACHVADVGDLLAIEPLLEGAQLCIHAAAEKDLCFCEDNPAAAIATNVLGTQNVAAAAMRAGLQSVLLISSDKAVASTNCLGSTKLLAEKLFAASGRAGAPTQFPIVRLCNVLGSARSIVPIIREQIDRGGPVTITSPQMTRFFITMDEAIALILTAACQGRSGELFLPKPRRIRIMQLARIVTAMVAPLHGHAPRDIEFAFSGPRPSEKLSEDLVFEDERGRLFDRGDCLVVVPSEGPRALAALDLDGPAPTDEAVADLLLRSGSVPAAVSKVAVLDRAPGRSDQQPVAGEGLRRRDRYLAATQAG